MSLKHDDFQYYTLILMQWKEGLITNAANKLILKSTTLLSYLQCYLNLIFQVLLLLKCRALCITYAQPNCNVIHCVIETSPLPRIWDPRSKVESDAEDSS